MLSNLGLSYVLSKELPKAEETLRRAHGLAPTDPRVRANLALVVGLQGRFADAEKIAKADLPPAEAAANVTQLKQLLSRKEKDNARAEVGKMPIAAARTLRLKSRGFASERCPIENQSPFRFHRRQARRQRSSRCRRLLLRPCGPSCPAVS